MVTMVERDHVRLSSADCQTATANERANPPTSTVRENSPVALVAASLALLATGSGCLGDLGGLLGGGLGHLEVGKDDKR